MSGAPPGWFEDPEDASFWRWWSGNEWGRRVPRDAASQPPPPATSQSAAPEMEWLSDGRVRAKKSATQKKKEEEDVWNAIGGIFIVAVLVWFFFFRGGSDDAADSGAVVPPDSGNEATESIDEEPETEERVRNESVDAPVEVLNYAAVSSEVLEVLFLVRNDEAVPMATVACSVSAYVSTQQVARLFGSGGTISDLAPGEQRRVTTSARIRGDQANAVTRAEVTCSARLPENRPDANSEVVPSDDADGDSLDGDGASGADSPEPSVEDIRTSVMPFVFDSSRAGIVATLSDLRIISSVDLYEYDPTTGRVLLDLTPAFDFDSGVRDDAWEVMRIFASGLYGGPAGNDGWVNTAPPFSPDLRVTISTATYECPGDVMQRLADARLSRSQWEEACRVR